jgi:phytanoyl-CoA hydroxylase
MLTAAQRRAFCEDGFMLVPELLGAASLERYDQRFRELAEGHTPLPDGLTAMRDVMIVKGAVDAASPLHAINKIMHFEQDPVLFGYAEEPGIQSIARQLVGAAADEPLHVLTTNVFNKPPDVDGRHPLHQDLRYFHMRPAEGIVAAWTALERCTRANGCLAVVPGSHRGGLREHGTPDWKHVNFAFYGVDEALGGARVHVEMAPGDTLFFHPLLIHGSGRNRSDGFRRAISAHYAADGCRAPGRDWRKGPHVRAIG